MAKFGNIDDELLGSYENIVLDALTKAGKKDWEEQIEKAINELTNIYPEVNSIDDATAEILGVYYCLFFIFRFMSMDAEDIFYQKQLEYDKKFNSLLNKVRSQGIDTDGDGVNDINLNMDLTR